MGERRPRASVLTYYLRSLGYLRPYRLQGAVCVAVMLLTVATGLLLPWPLKLLIDNVVGTQPLPPRLAALVGEAGTDRVRLLVLVVVASLAVTLLHNALTVLGKYVLTWIEQRMALDFRGELFQHAQRLSLAYHDRRQAGELLYAINLQGPAAAGLATIGLPLLQSALSVVGMLWIALHINTSLALLSLSVVPLLYICVGQYGRVIQQRLGQVKGMESQSLSIVSEALSMLRVILAFGREDQEQRRFQEAGERAATARVRVTLRQTLFSLAVNMVTACGVALVLGVGAFQVLHGQLTIGELLVVMAYVHSVYGPLQSISATVGSVHEHVAGLRLAFGLLDTEPEIRDAPGAKAIGRSAGHVVYENVSFRYRRRGAVLKDVSFEARPGQVVAIVGPTGAGKSTLASLLPRFYDAREGRILLDGIDVRELTLVSLRQQVSFVLQEALLFSGSIAENIRYGRPQASMEEIVEAAKAANAHEFVEQMPDGYETQVGERGVQLSGGERQRVSIARAFLKDAPILVLDEPTSAIDSHTESVILEALGRLMAGRTTLMVAHRLSTIRGADCILVLRRGKLTDRGTHDELIGRPGLYRQLYTAQVGWARRVQREVALAVPVGEA